VPKVQRKSSQKLTLLVETACGAAGTLAVAAVNFCGKKAAQQLMNAADARSNLHNATRGGAGHAACKGSLTSDFGLLQQRGAKPLRVGAERSEASGEVTAPGSS
jgi:hypothetical protein